MNRRTIALLLAFLICIQAVPAIRTTFAQEAWKGEFDTICAKTDEAMTLTKDELTGLLGQCDLLRAKIEAENESTRKVYLRRLQMCQELYRYVLRSRFPDP